MRSLLFLLLTLFILTGCDDGKKSKTPENDQKVEHKEERPLKIEDDNGNLKEWYPGHKQLKMSGRKDAEGKRTGIWRYFSEQGVELSVTVYSHGVKDGHIIVKHPNGTVYYVGEYLNGEPVGVWEFYDENGQRTQTKDYDKE